MKFHKFFRKQKIIYFYSQICSALKIPTGIPPENTSAISKENLVDIPSEKQQIPSEISLEHQNRFLELASSAIVIERSSTVTDL